MDKWSDEQLKKMKVGFWVLLPWCARQLEN